MQGQSTVNQVIGACQFFFHKIINDKGTGERGNGETGKRVNG